MIRRANVRNLKKLLIGATFLTVFLTSCSNGGEEEMTGDRELIEPKDFPSTFLKGDYEQVYSQMSKAFQDEVTLKQLRELGDDFNQDVISYKLQSELPYSNGVRQYAWTDDSGSKGMVAVFDEADVIQGLQIMPLTNYPETDEVYTKTVMDLPFHDTWFVLWGGTNSLVNYHYDYENQRYAYDFVIMNEHSTYVGDPELNESYYAFGKEYLAPAAGTVVKVENRVKDNKPVGKMNEKQPLGNYVILDHGNNEFSYLAHFKYESVLVKEGDQVDQGKVLGQVGNSGNSSEPHIHFHVADSPDFMKSKSINSTFDREDTLIQGDFVEK